MLLNIITGEIGSGKSSRLYKLIKENLANNPGTNAVLIVPEQFSYTAEKTLAEKMGGLGLNRIDVVTFSRLVHKFVNTAGGITPSGRIMLVCKAVSQISTDNMFFASRDKNGFASSVSELFSELRRYGITAEDFDRISPENPHTRKKLSSLNEIYRGYAEALPDSLDDSDDFLGLFADFAASTDVFKDTFFFIDDYSDFLPPHYEAIRALIKASRGVFITLCAADDAEDGLFASALKTKKRLCAIALSEGAQLYTESLSSEPVYIKSNEIRHLLTHWENKDKYNGSCEDISVFTARDLYSEIEHTAAEIISLVRDKGYRFRDIGVIIGDMPSYLHILNAVFSDFDIPFFTDEKLTVTMHPVARTVMALFGIINENWSYSAVFDYLRTGYVYIKDENGVSPLDPESIDLLDNYVVKHGIRGKKSWFSEWTEDGETIFDDVIENRSRPDADLESLNALRRKIILPFENFLANKTRSVRAIAEAVYGFLCDINLYEGILSECDRLDRDGLRDESERLKQSWNFIIDVLDQAVTVFGDEAVSRETFFNYFKNGLSQCSISIIPSGLDRVSVGTVERNSPARVRALFIIGATHGAIPCEPSPSVILTSLDRELINSGLAAFEKELAPDDLSRITLENLKLYRIISTATEKLYVSRPSSNADGGALSPARIVTDLIGMFPNMTITDNVILKLSSRELLSSPKRGFHYMLSRLSEYGGNAPGKLQSDIYGWYASQDRYKNKLNILNAAAQYKAFQPQLSQLRAQALYGKNKKYSITALEKYTSCPFAYYVERGLRARPQEEKRIEKSHIGSLIHSAVRDFCERVESGADSISEIRERWSELTDDAGKAIIRSVIDDMKRKILPRAETNKGQVEYLLDRCERTLEKSVATIRMSLADGDYAAVGYEKDFEVAIKQGGGSVTLYGTIDRIDIAELAEEKKANIRIIDYKSGRKSFSVSAICSKTDMQLVLYAAAASELYKDGLIDKADPKLTPQISAVMYNKINDDIISIAKNSSELAENEIKKRRKLDGVVILDEENGVVSCENAFSMDRGLEEGGNSDFLKLSLKSDGSLSSASQVMTRDTFNLLSDYMKKTVITTDKEIMSGKIDIKPCVSSSGSACDYCDFGEICMFDSGRDSVRKAFSDDGAALEFIKKEMSEDE